MNPHADVPLLVVEDDTAVGVLTERMLGSLGFTHVQRVENVADARRVLEAGPVALVLCDFNLPDEPGVALLPDVEKRAPDTVQVMVTALQDVELAVSALKAGALDYILKPFTRETLRVGVERALEQRDMRRELRAYRVNLERLVDQRTAELQRRNTELLATQRALLRAFCEMAEFRDPETGRHLDRMAHYSRELAHHLSQHGSYAARINTTWVQHLFEAAPLHDVGKVGIPDHVLLKPGKHTPEERAIMETHPLLGRRAIEAVKQQLPEGAAFLDVAIEVAVGHHERWDGLGYPARISGESIPLAARIVAVADFYDACSSPRVYRPYAMPHAEVRALLEADRGKRFDPAVLDAFHACEDAFLRIRRDLADGTPHHGVPVLPLALPSS